MGSLRTPESSLRLIAVTPGVGTASDVVARARDAMRGGVTSVWLRERHRSDAELRGMLGRLCVASEPTGAAIVISGRPDLAEEFGLFGVHLGFPDPRVADVRRDVGPGIRVGYSAHDPLEATSVNVADYITLSPVYPTRKADREVQSTPLGLDRFAMLAAGVDCPVVGLGGISAGLVADVIGSGACGIAVMGAIFSAKDSGSAAEALRSEVDQARSSRIDRPGSHRPGTPNSPGADDE